MVVVLVQYLLPALLPFLVGAVIAMLLRPLACSIRHTTRMKYAPSAVTAALIFYGLALLLTVSLGFLIFAQAISLFTRLPELFTDSLIPAASAMWDRSAGWVAGLLPTAGVYMERLSQWTTVIVGEALSQLSQTLLHWAGSLVKGFPSAVFGCFLGVLSSVLLLVDYDGVAAALSSLLTTRLRLLVHRSKKFLIATGSNVIKAYFLLMLLTFVEVSAGLWLLGIEYWAVMGIVVAVVDVLPILGSGAVLIPWGVWQLVSGNPGQGIGILVLYGIVVVVRTIAEPKILGDRIGLPPLVTILSMYLGLRFMGVAGLVLVPMLVTLVVHLARHGHLDAQTGDAS